MHFFARRRAHAAGHVPGRSTTKGLFPTLDGVFATPYRETLFTGRSRRTSTPNNYLSVRYGRNQNSQPYGAARNRAPSNWGDSKNKFNSINVNHNSVLGGSKLNEFIFQYADFSNNITAAQHRRRYETVPERRGDRRRTPNTPQTTQQKKYQFRDDFSWHVAGHGRPRPRLQGRRQLHQRAAPVHHLQHRQGRAVSYTHLTNDVNGPISTVTRERRRRVGEHPAQAVRVLHPGRLARRPIALTLNLGLRYDLIDGLPVRSVEEPELREDAERRQAPGLLDGHQGPRELRPGSEGRQQQLAAAHRLRLRPPRRRQGRHPRRLGHLHRLRLHQLERAVRGERRDRQRLRRGVRRSTTSRASATRTAASTAPASRCRTSQPEPGRAALPLFGQFIDPRLQMPYTRQTLARLVARADVVDRLHRRLRARRRPRPQHAAAHQRACDPGRRRAGWRSSNVQPAAIGTRPAISAARASTRR